MVDFLYELAADFWGVIGEMSPYLLLGFFVAGLLSVLISQETVERQIGSRGILSVFKASLFGVPLPLCSCGVIPVGMSLRRHGAGRGASAAFLISTPQTGVDSIMVTLSLLGPLFAIVRPVAALVTGMAGGLLVNLLDREEGGEPGGVAEGAACVAECCAGTSGRGRLARAMRYGFVTLPGDIGRFLVVGLVIAALVSAIVPDNYFSGYLGRGIVPMLAMMLMGIPMYVCSTASVPVAAALMAAGVSPGAALAFLMTGPATNAATITTIWNVLGRRTAVIYLGTIAVGALASGLLLDALASGVAAHLHTTMHWMLPGWVKTVSAVVLIAVLVPALRRKAAAAAGVAAEPAAAGEGETVELAIRGMTCSHCVENVTRALRELDEVEKVSVNLKSGRGIVSGRNLDRAELIGAVKQLGYSAE